METIRIERLTKSFEGIFQLGPLDLRVERGEVLGVMGPNGAGKTTLLRLLWGFTRPDGGQVWVLRMKPHLNQVNVRLRAGYVSENPQFYSRLTATQFLRFIGRFYEDWDEVRSNGLLQQFGIQSNLRIESLSKGNRIKLGLIAAVGHRPSLLLLDEPTSGLDPLVRVDILRFLKKLAREESVSIVLSSHISDDLDQIADTVMMLDKGRAIEYACTSTLIEKYGKPRLEEIFVTAIGNQHNS